MSNYERFKKALKEYEEKKFQELQAEVKKMKENIEHFLTLFFESTASKSQTRYSTLNMY